eukprot:14095555-Alexandrium_andersonii.AAC.1
MHAGHNPSTSSPDAHWRQAEPRRALEALRAAAAAAHAQLFQHQWFPARQGHNEAHGGDAANAATAGAAAQGRA